jgi:RNA polymerase sigma-70 factor (sigma-E family)
MSETRTVGLDAADAAGSTGGLQELFVRHAPSATRLAYFLCGDRDLAQDLVQDAFVKVAGRFGHLRVPDAFDAYLRRTIVNLFTSHLRRLRLERAELRRERSLTTLEHRDPDPAERDAMWRALQRLPIRQRAAVVLRFYEDLSEHEAADVLGCAASALNALVRRAMATLRNEIGDEES